MAAAAVIGLGGIATAPAFNGSPSVFVTSVEERWKDKHDKKRRKPVKAKAAPRKRWFGRPAVAGTGPRPDLRHDKYLHSHARNMRRWKWSLEQPGKLYPFDRLDYRGEVS